MVLSKTVTQRGRLLGAHYVAPVAPSQSILAHVPFVRPLTTTGTPEEPLYDVDGSHLSKTQVLAMDPVDRSIAAWRILVDWELKKLRPYVMVDPYDPSGLLYLPYHEYVVTMRTLAAARATIILVCRPETQQPKPVSSPKTPPLNEIRGCILDSDLFVPSWRAFTSLREWIRRNINIVAEKGMVKVDHGNVVGLVNLWGRELLHILAVKSPGTKVEGLLPLAEHLQTLLRHCGVSYTIKRMKIYLFVLNSFVGGNPVASTDPFGVRVRLRSGLPAFLSRSVRDSLRSRNLDAVRLYASLFSLYKAIEGPHKLSDLSTIGAPPLGEEAAEILSEFSTFVDDRLLNAFPLRSGKRLPGWKYETGWGTVISSAGANSPHAMLSILMDAYAWSRQKVNHAALLAKEFGDKKVGTILTRMAYQGRVLVALNGIYLGVAQGKKLTVEWARNWGDTPVSEAELESVDTSAMLSGGGYDKVPDSLWLAVKRVFPDKVVRAFDDKAFLRLRDHYIVASKARDSAKLGQIRYLHFPRSPVLGRLHSIPEAAGKVRVVAICDYFTQILCKPIHQFLFKVLATISMDGTFDQQAAVDSFAKEGHKEIFSYDLTAATDMIPLQLYSIVVGRLIGKGLAQKWVNLLSDRSFLKPRDHLEDLKESGDKGTSCFIRYSRGQPMGALSSWAGLAIVHHAIILFAADKANLESSQVAYRVLGDDVIISGSALALSYRAVCESLGIPIGDYKSYKSKTGLFNFASQTLLGTENVSAVSFKELVQATTWAGRIEMARRLLHRYGASRTSLLRLGVFAPMWQLLTAELSGVKPLHFVRFVRFVLRNPFLIKKDEEEIRIDDLLTWLGEISPTLGLVSADEKNEFELCFKRALVASILKKWNTLFLGTKKVHGFRDGLKLESPYSEMGAGLELHYITQCYAGQNKRFYQKALRMYRQVTDGLWIGGGAALSLKVERLSLTQLVIVFVYLSSVPTPVWFVRPNGSSKYDVIERVLFDTIGRRDPDEPDGSSTGPTRPNTSGRPQESLRGPVLELTTLVARVFGRVVPVPEVAGLTFSSRWWRHISSAIELNIARRADLVRSPCLAQVSLVPYGTEPMEMVSRPSPGCYAVVLWNPDPGIRQR